MARRFDSKTFEYIPEAFDNHKDPDPVVLVIRFPTETERRAYARSAKVPTTDDPIGWAEPLMGYVVEVRNYAMPEGPVLTGADLFRIGETELIIEAADAVFNAIARLSAMSKKNSNGCLGSTPAAMPASVGTAASAEEPSSISSAAALSAPSPTCSSCT